MITSYCILYLSNHTEHTQYFILLIFDIILISKLMLWNLLKRLVIMLYDIVLLTFIGIIWNTGSFVLYYYNV